MNRQQTWTVPKIIYAILMSFLLLGYMIIIATYKDPTTTGQSYNIPIQFWVLRLITAVLAIYLGKLWKDKGFLILMAYLFLKAIRVAVDNPSNLFDPGVSDDLLTGLWIFSACYGLARVFEKEQLKKYVFINATIWTVCMVIYSCIGIYAAWTEKWIYTIGQGAAWGVIKYGRLYLSYYVTTSAAVLSFSSVIALAGAFISKRTANKVLFVLSVFPMMIALCLTDTRSAHVTFSVGLSVMIGIAILRLLRNYTAQRGRYSWVAWPCAIVITGVLFFITLRACSGIITLFNQIHLKGLLIPHALADGAYQTSMLNRGFSGDDLLSARQDIWKATLQALWTNKKLLFIGTSIYHPMDIVNAQGIFADIASHTHNLPLMILLETGIPGLLLAGCFFVNTAIQSVRLVVMRENRWERFLVPIIISVTVGELVECFLWLRAGTAPILPFFFIVIGLIIRSKEID